MSTCGIIQRWLSRCSGRSLTEQPRAVCLNRRSPDRMVAAHWPGHTAQVQGGRPMNPRLATWSGAVPLWRTSCLGTGLKPSNNAHAWGLPHTSCSLHPTSAAAEPAREFELGVAQAKHGPRDGMQVQDVQEAEGMRLWGSHGYAQANS